MTPPDRTARGRNRRGRLIAAAVQQAASALLAELRRVPTHGEVRDRVLAQPALGTPSVSTTLDAYAEWLTVHRSGQAAPPLHLPPELVSEAAAAFQAIIDSVRAESSRQIAELQARYEADIAALRAELKRRD